MASTSTDRPALNHRGVIIAAVLLMLIGWVGLYQLVTTTLPLAFARWLFFMLLFMAVTGTAIPFVRFLNLRFTPAINPSPAGGVILRQSVWVGLFAVTCAWLQIPRVLNAPVAFFLGLSFVVIEVYLRLRERADTLAE
ncbi:MAG: hypothetical protein JW910_19655 [Anaerolineae bacterium]|nr:hypothetical protein [Anaerolineae bacterium]